MTRWRTDFSAERYGPVAPGTVRGRSQLQRSGDDWLNLNVWTPATVASEALPVLVWLHGGGYMMGSSGDDGGIYDGTALAREGLVVASINYRLAAEGFVQLQGAPPNRGLLDQIAALEWVRDSIAEFGGDPTRVTIAGQSAGAGSVQHLMTMPAARGLFHGAIAMSPPRLSLDAELAEDIARAIGRQVGLPPTRAAFASRDPQELGVDVGRIMAQLPRYALRWSRAGGLALPFAPVVDGVVVPGDPWAALRAGASADIPLVTGYARDEGAVFRTSITDNFGAQPRISWAKANFMAWLVAPHRRLRAFKALRPDETPSQLHDRAYTDWLFVSAAMHGALAHTAGGGRSHVYLIHLNPIGGIGSPHAIDVPMLFDHYEGMVARVVTPQPDDPVLQRTAAAFRRAWTDFVKTGEPGWPAWDERQLVKIWGSNTLVAPYPDQARLDFTLTDPCRPYGLRR